VKLLLDEMYPAALAEDLRAAGIDAVTVHDLGLGGSSDHDLFAAAAPAGYAVLTENVADFAAIATEHLNAGKHHPGLIIALSNRLSRRPAGRRPLIAAIKTHARDTLEDRIIYLDPIRRR
jgi:predicted nuclease of predicted toxin-antitoxin system